MADLVKNFIAIYFSVFISQYKIMPETENRSLEDIEMHFSGTDQNDTHINPYFSCMMQIN